jgi:drug/metabolite transporter (DMT)-like permease
MMKAPGSGGVARAAPVLAIAALATSSGAVLVRLAESPAAVTAFWRLALSVGILLPILLYRGDWRDWRALDWRDVSLLVVSGLCLAFHFLAWFRSLDFTSVASSTVLVSTHPLFVGILSARLLRERPTRREWFGLALAVAGALVIGWGGFRAGADPLRGDLLAISAAVFAALYFIAGRRLRGRIGLLPYVVPVYAIAAVTCLLYGGSTDLQFAGWPSGTWWALIGLAVGPTLLGHTGFNWALRHVRAYVVSVILLFEPLGATLLAILVLGRAELPGWNTLIGGTAILVGVWVSIRARFVAPDPHGTAPVQGGGN